MARSSRLNTISALTITFRTEVVGKVQENSLRYLGVADAAQCTQKKAHEAAGKGLKQLGNNTGFDHTATSQNGERRGDKKKKQCRCQLACQCSG